MFDKRVVRRHVTAGRVTEQEFEAFLEALPDVARNIRAHEEGGDDDGYDRVPASAGGSGPSAVSGAGSFGPSVAAAAYVPPVVHTVPDRFSPETEAATAAFNAQMSRPFLTPPVGPSGLRAASDLSEEVKGEADSDDLDDEDEDDDLDDEDEDDDDLDDEDEAVAEGEDESKDEADSEPEPEDEKSDDGTASSD